MRAASGSGTIFSAAGGLGITPALPKIALMKKRRILLNAVALVTLGSGVLNLLSVIGPSLPERGALLRQLYPLEYLRVSRFPAHDSQDEWKGWMLEGRMVLELWELKGKTVETLVCEEGDAFIFGANVHHAWRNDGPKPARMAFTRKIDIIETK